MSRMIILALAAAAVLMGCRKDQPATTTTTGASVPDVPVNTAYAKPDAGTTSAGIAVGGDPATGGGAPAGGLPPTTAPGAPQHDGFLPQFGAKPPSADDAKHMPFGDEGMAGRSGTRAGSNDTPSTQPAQGGHPHGGSADVGNSSTGAGSSQSGGSQSGGSQGTAGARPGNTPTDAVGAQPAGGSQSGGQAGGANGGTAGGGGGL